MNDDGWVFYPDDLVCYSEQHYEWMKMAARWPSIHLPRTTLKGRVTQSTRKTVTVLWDGVAAPLTHFPENLELLVSHNYKESEQDG